MKLRVLALDYDGTIARDGALDAEVRAAIADVRALGCVVVLATGRILDDLRCLVGDLTLFDAIVAENGAVVAYPGAGRSTQLAPTAPGPFVTELWRRNLVPRVGACVVELPASDAEVVLQVVRELELPLTLHFNRGRLMVLPQAVSKATGLREALRTMRLSPHNAIAVGDAENDHELLALCELGAAVEWGSPALQRAADVVVRGHGPPAVASFLRDAAASERITLSATARRQLLLGRDARGESVALAVRGRNVLIAGDPRSGKSWVAGLLCEQLIVQQYCTCILDPEGDYTDLERLPGVIVLGHEHPPSAAEITRLLRHADVSLVLDLSRQPPADKPAYAHTVLRLLADLRRTTGLPHRVVVDEAHYFLRDADDAELLAPSLGGCTLITYRISSLAPQVLRSAECVIVTRESDPHEAGLLHATFAGAGVASDWAARLAALALDEAALLPVTAEAQGQLRLLRIAPRLTRHVRHRHKYLDVPTVGERAFRFDFGGTPGPVVASLSHLVRVLACTPAQRIHEHLRRSDLSRWIGDVFGDVTLAGIVRGIEEQHVLGRLPDVNDALIHAILARYGDDAPSP
jgi:hydroxymethylpyrimidine pyrophosphatase-like HAD family hydrolase